MFQYFYTTKMSAGSKSLQQRFTKMRSSSGKTSKIMALICALTLAISTLCATIVFAAVDGANSNISSIDIKANGKNLSFQNQPFCEDGTLYLPLRELLDNIGLMDNEGSEIHWDNGTISLFLYEAAPDDPGLILGRSYELKIGSTQLSWNVHKAEAKPKVLIDIYKMMQKPPVLKNSVTYVPFEYLRTILGSDATGSTQLLFSVTSPDGEILSYLLPRPQWPCDSDRISAPYRDDHQAIDIVAEPGSQVLATISGTVTETGFDKQLGNYVVIANEYDIACLYAQLSSVAVESGAKVQKGDVVAYVGSTGMATGPHLHLEFLCDSFHLNPITLYGIKAVPDSTRVHPVTGTIVQKYQVTE